MNHRPPRVQADPACFVGSDGVLRAGASCPFCSHPIGGLRLGDYCRGCGEPIGFAHVKHLLRHAPRDWLKRLRVGLYILITAYLASFTLSLAAWMVMSVTSPATESHTFAPERMLHPPLWESVLSVLIAAALYYGAFLILTPRRDEPLADPGHARWFAEKALLASAALYGIKIVLTLVRNTAELNTVDVSSVFRVFDFAVFAVLVFNGLHYFAILLEELPEAALARYVRIIAWIAMVALAFGVLGFLQAIAVQPLLTQAGERWKKMSPADYSAIGMMACSGVISFGLMTLIPPALVIIGILFIRGIGFALLYRRAVGEHDAQPNRGATSPTGRLESTSA